MNIPFIDLKPQHRAVRAGVLKNVARVYDSCRFVLGEHGASLENSVTKMTGARFAVGLASGSDALYLALAALGIGPGDEVITSPFTFFATASAISRTGARPVFADIDPKTFALDPEAVQRKITRRTKAVLPVHLYGLCCDMRELMRLARARKLFIVEDAAQAFGALDHGRYAGAMGDAGCYSFYPTKNLGGAGDGGMLVTSSRALAAKVRSLRDHGQVRKYVHEVVGINSRLDEWQAVVLAEKLKHLRRWNARRAAIARTYDRGLAGLPLETPYVPEGRTHVYHLYTVRTRQRDRLARYLSRAGIGAGVYYPLPMQLQPCYRSLGGRKGDLPEAERACAEALSIPMYAELSRGSVQTVIRTIRSFFGSK